MQLQESDDYNIYSKDCIPDNRGGGIFQVMKKDIFVTHRDDLDTDCEVDGPNVRFKTRRSKSLFFTSFYRPNRNDIDSLQELGSSIFK